MLTSGKVNKTTNSRHFFQQKTHSECQKQEEKIMWKMLTTFVENPQNIPKLQKVIPTPPVDKTKSLISFCLAKQQSL